MDRYRESSELERETKIALMPKRHKLILMLTFLLPLLAFGQTEPTQFDPLLRHAKTYLWLGLYEDYNLQAFETGLSYLGQAEATLDSGDDPTDPVLQQQQLTQISSLRQTLHHQISIGKGTYYGLFPLVRLIGQSLFIDVEVNGTFEIADDAPVMAFTNAIKRLAETLSQELSVQPQFGVLLRSFPADDELLNEAYFLLRDSFQLDIDFDHEWKSRLSADEQQFVFGNQGLITPSIIEKLCSQIQRQKILLVTVEAVDQVDGIYHYQATGQVYQAGQRKPAYTVVSRGFSRDLQNQIPPILLTHLIFFLICLLITGLIRLSGSSGYSLILSSMGQDLLAVGLSFLIGAILPQILVAMLDGFRPDGDTPPLFAFWWSSLFGLLLLVLPIALHRLVLAPRLPESVRVQLSNRGGLVCLTLAMGGCTCLISPACLYFQLQAWQILVPAALISASLGYFFGWTLDDSTIPAAAIGIPITASIPYGIAFTYANSYLLWALLATSSLTIIFIWQRFYLRTG